MKRSRVYKAYLKSPTLSSDEIPKQTTSSRNKKLPKRHHLKTNTQPRALNFSSNILLDDAAQDNKSLDDETESNSGNISDYESDFLSSDESGDSSSTEVEPEITRPANYMQKDLFPHSKINQDESSLLIYSFVLRHKISKSGLDDLLGLIRAHMPLGAVLPSSRFLLMKSLKFDYSSASTEFYCPDCKGYLDQDSTYCVKCDLGFAKQKLKEKGSFFISFNPKEALKQVLKDQRVKDNLFVRFTKRSRSKMTNEITSMLDGSCYKDLGLGYNDLTCALNSDGVPVFKSSKISMWPILFTINELDFALCRKHVICLGIWFGLEKPYFDCFLKPFVEVANQLASEGISWKCNEVLVNSKVYFPLLVADSVARPLLQGLQQFNGSYGCTWCLCKGESLKSELNPKSHKWIYAPIDKQTVELRNSRQFISHLKEFEGMLSTQVKCKSHFGIKTASRLLLVPKFCIINGFTFDYMHTALLGITRTLTNAWLDTRNHSKTFYIGNKLDCIDQVLLRCLVPFNFDRSVRSITHRSYWKANEWRTWAYVAGFVLRGILDTKYLEHFSKFVQALMILCGEGILPEELDCADDLLFSFVEDTQILYGLSYCSYNMHLLLHAGQTVRNWGPLPLYSAFNFENFNGVLLNFFKGAYKVPVQISNKILELMQLPELCKLNLKSGAAKILHENLRKPKFRQSAFANDACVLGRCTLQMLTSNDKNKFEALGYPDCESFSTYKSCMVKSNLYSINEKTTSKRCNSIVSINGIADNLYMIRKVIVLPNDEICVVLSKIKVSKNIDVPNCYDVIKVKVKTIISPITHIDCAKFIVIRNEDCSIILSIVRIPNTYEVE